MPLIILLGPPGVGKGTQASRINQRLGIGSISTGDLLRQAKRSGSHLGQRIAELIDNGHLVPDDIIIDLVFEELARPEHDDGCLLDGFPRTVPQAEALDGHLRKHRLNLDLAVELRVDGQELMRRLLSRANSEGRADDTPETVKHRLQVYHRQTAPLVDYYRRSGRLQTIDAMGTPDEVFARIERSLDETLGMGL